MLAKIFYYGFILPLSYLPFRILYFIADFLAILLHYLLRYRKKLILKNLALCFPNLSQRHIRKLCFKHYQHFSDHLLESIKAFHISREEAINRFKIVNPPFLDAYADSGKSVLLCLGHYANFELGAVAIALQCRHLMLGIYTPLSNAFMDKKLRNSREKYGLKAVSKRLIRSYFADSKPGIPYALALIADQSPRRKSKSYFQVDFLGRPTAFVVGIESYSRRYDLPVVFCRIDKIKRGYYELTFDLIVENPSDMPERGSIIEQYVRRLESQIQAQPEYWWWTHNRWKHDLTSVK